jgi:hypothetical protein
MDVSTAFLYGEADADIYMKQPPGHTDGTSKVCKLRRSIYGLKQAPRIWRKRLEEALINMGFKRAQCDQDLYILERGGETLYLLGYVDDLLLAGRDLELMSWVKQCLATEFTMKELGEAQVFIGMRIHRDRKGGQMWLHQAPYCLDMAVRFGVADGKYPATPLPSDFVLYHPWEMKPKKFRINGEWVEDIPPPPPEGAEPILQQEEIQRFQQIVGCIMYAAHTTRVDVAHATAQLSRVTTCPRARHMAAAERTLRYLAGTADWGLHFQKEGGAVLECFTDANYGGSSTDQKSVTGILLRLGGGPIYWTCRKQDRITTSTCDAEAQALMVGVQYIENARDLLDELGLTQRWPTPLYCDNSATVNLGCDPV